MKSINPLITVLTILIATHQCSAFMVGSWPEPNMKSEKSAKPRKKTLKKDGWRVPGIDGYKTVSTVKERRVDGVEVTQKVFAVEVRPVVDLDGNTVGNIDQKGINVTLEIARKKKRLFDVRDFSTYEVNGRVFGYGVTLVPLVIESNLRTYAGAMYSLFYYDEDGDGRFETRYSGLPLPKTPTWVSIVQSRNN